MINDIIIAVLITITVYLSFNLWRICYSKSVLFIFLAMVLALVVRILICVIGGTLPVVKYISMVSWIMWIAALWFLIAMMKALLIKDQSKVSKIRNLFKRILK
jgi:hypothetical protein